jgi:hypothetical protein
MVIVSACVVCVTGIAGLVYFRRVEGTFADIL